MLATKPASSLFKIGRVEYVTRLLMKHLARGADLDSSVMLVSKTLFYKIRAREMMEVAVAKKTLARGARRYFFFKYDYDALREATENTAFYAFKSYIQFDKKTDRQNIMTLMANVVRHKFQSDLEDNLMYINNGFRLSIEVVKLTTPYMLVYRPSIFTLYRQEGTLRVPVVTTRYARQSALILDAVATQRAMMAEFPNTRWARHNNLSPNLYKVLRNAQILQVQQFNAPLESVRNEEANTYISISQKRIDKTTFSSKLMERGYSHRIGNKHESLVYAITKGIISIVGDHYFEAYNTLKNNHHSVTQRDSVNQLNKSYPFQKRLLWVNKVLLIPTRMAITITTNSYDVIHSWFVPGLGMKLDCVPGRATHHTIYVEYMGYYYGQCAEVCGRRHHHMPIKIRAIPFKFFEYWWKQTLYGAW